MSDLLSWSSDWTLDQQSHALSLACGAFNVEVTKVLLVAFAYNQSKLEGIASYTATCEHTPDQIHSSREEKFAFRRSDGTRRADVIATLLHAHCGLVTGVPQADQHLLTRLLVTIATSPFRVGTLRLLLQGGADPNHRSEDSAMTALQMALIVRRDVGSFNEEGVKALLDYGARTDVTDEAAKSKLENWRRESMGGSL